MADRTRSVFAIDPGYSESAYVHWDGSKIIARGNVSNDQIWVPMEDAMMVGAEPAIEMVSSYGMRVGKEVFETCVWIGRFIETAIRMPNFGLMPDLVVRMDIKKWHTGRGSTKDADVRAALIEKYGAPGVKANPGLTYGLVADQWQAFALATYLTESGRVK